MTDIPPPLPGYHRDSAPPESKIVYERAPIEWNWPAIIGVELLVIILLLIPILIGVFVG